MRVLRAFALVGVALLAGCGGGGGGGATASDAASAAALTWTEPRFNTDGSALTDIAGYRIYHGTSPSSLSQFDAVDATVTRASLTSLASGTHYFAVSTLNSTGDESALSGTVTLTLP